MTVVACTCGVSRANFHAAPATHGDACPVKITAREKERQASKNPIMNTIFTPSQQGPAVTEDEIEALREARAAINKAITNSRAGSKVHVSDKPVMRVIGSEVLRATLFTEIAGSGWQPSISEGQRGEMTGLVLIPTGVNTPNA